MELGQHSQVRTILEETKKLPSGPDFFEIERLLIQERLEPSSPELCGRLDQAIVVSEALGTEYQASRMRIALAKHLLAINDRDRANVVAKMARRISTKNGYKGLAARALLLIGLSADRVGEQESALQQAMDEAGDQGFAPLLAEAAFQLGNARFSRGDYDGVSAIPVEEHFHYKPSSRRPNLGDRKSYLFKADNRTARMWFNEALQRTVSAASTMSTRFVQEANLFANTYQLAATMTSARDSGSAIDALVQTLKETLSHFIVVVSGSGPKATFHAARGAVAEETRKRITSIASSASDKPYLAGPGLGKRGTNLWIPILSVAFNGGIYVESLRSDLPINERDIEFVTVVATISAAALDRIYSKAIVSRPPSATDVYGIVGTSKQVQKIWADYPKLPPQTQRRS